MSNATLPSALRHTSRTAHAHTRTLHCSRFPAGGNCTTAVGLIVDDADGLWKLITGDESQYYVTGPHYPNASTTTDSQNAAYTKHCGNGCLYNLRVDPMEKEDLSGSEPGMMARLWTKLEEYEATAFNPHRGTVDPEACITAATKWGGFWGPWMP